MERTIMYKTLDGKLHDTEKQATKHLEILYADVLCKLSRDLIQLNYSDHAEYIDKNLPEFHKLIVIKNDMNLITDNNDWKDNLMTTLYELSDLDTFDARDLNDRLNELESMYDRIKELEEILLDEFVGDEYTSDEIDDFDSELDDLKDEFDSDEYDALLELADELGDSTLRDGETMIRESYITDYFREFVYDIGALPKDLPSYIESNINWDGVCDDLLMDYSEVEIEGVTFYFRSY